MTDAPALPPSFPELRLFDPRATRSAVFRGVLRSAILGLALYWAFLAVGDQVGSLLYAAHDRGERVDRIGAYAYVAGHPGASYRQGELDHGWRGTTRDVVVGAGDRVSELTMRVGVSGAVTFEGAAPDPVMSSIKRGRASHDAAVRFAEGLPAAAVVDAVIELEKPIADTSSYAAREGWDLDVRSDFYADPALQLAVVSNYNGVDQDRPLSWPASLSLSGLDGQSFKDWAATLRSGDDEDLHRQGLPESARIRAAAEEGRIYAWYATGMSRETLLKVLASPLIRTVTPVGVSFDVLDRVQQ